MRRFPPVRPARAALVALLALMVAAGVAAGSHGGQAPAAGRHLVVVQDTAEGSAALDSSSARVIARYDSFTLAEAVGRDVSRLERVGGERRDDMRTVQLGDRALDPATERPALRPKRGARSRRGLALVQFVGPIKDAWLRRLRDTGVRLVSYASQNAYLVHGDAGELGALARLPGKDPAVRSVTAFAERDKLGPGVKGGGRRAVAVQTLSGVEGADARRLARSGRRRRDPSAVGPLRTEFVTLEAADIERLARDPGVVAIRRYARPELRDERASQIVAANLTSAPPIAPTGPGYLSFLVDQGFGSGTLDFAVDVTDEGLDGGSPPAPGAGHPDFYASGDASGSTRVDYVENWTTDADGRDCGGHGTINGSIIGGFNDGSGAAVADAQGFRYGLGVAPRVRLGGSKIFACGGSFDLTGTFTELTSNAYANGARVSSNSWGANTFGGYDDMAQEYDALVRDARPEQAGNQEIVEVFAAGNAGSGAGSVGSPASAKNVITAGASENVRSSGTDGCGVTNSDADDARDIVDFSSRGPTEDGRLKPDVVAPGTHVSGAQPQHADYEGDGVCNAQFPSGSSLYSLSSGTSHSTPVVAGAAALARDWYRRVLGGGSQAPSPAMTKALLVNTATDVAGGKDGAGGTTGHLPDGDQGFGLVNLSRAFDSTQREVTDQSTIFGESGESLARVYTAADSTKPVKVTLVWTDAPGPTFGDAFVNDLDLTVDHGGSTYKGNVFSAGQSVTGGSADQRNNVENVFLPAATTGSFSVAVGATSVGGDGVPGNSDSTDQDFALVVSNATEVQAPLLAQDEAQVTDKGDGDGVLEPGEDFAVDKPIRNAGSAPATGLTGTLSAGSSSVELFETGSAYPDVPVSGTSANATPFTGWVSNAAQCGKDLSLTLDVDSDQGSYAFPFTLPTGTVGSVVQRTSADVPVSIPDDDPAGATSALEVTSAGVLKDVDVSIAGISHTWVGDLKLELIAPDGTMVVLVDRPGGPGNSGNDFEGTIFDDEAGAAIGSGSAPYAGRFRPQSDQLSRLDGHQQQGTWKLRVTDLAGLDEGTIDAWGVDSRTAECSPTPASSPPEDSEPPAVSNTPPAPGRQPAAETHDQVDLADAHDLEFLERMHRVRPDRRGRFRFAFLAPAGETGRITFKTARAFGRSNRRRLRIGSKRFTVPEDGLVEVRVRLSSHRRRLLRRKRKLLVRAGVTVGDRDRGTLFTLKAPRRR